MELLLKKRDVPEFSAVPALPVMTLTRSHRAASGKLPLSQAIELIHLEASEAAWVINACGSVCID